MVPTVVLDVSREGLSHLDDVQIVTDMVLWPSLVKSAHIQDKDILTDQTSTEYQYLRDCLNDPDFFRMYADKQCVFLWLQALEHGTVSSIDNILPVVTKKERDEGASSKPQQNGGLRCTLQGSSEQADVKGYWKPCRSEDMETNSETFSAEIVAFHIDHIMGFYRTPAVVPRVFSHRQLQLLASEAEHRTVEQDPEASMKIQSVEKHCGRFNGEFVDGAMVGWSPKEIQLISKHVDKQQKADLFVKFNSMDEEKLDLLKDTKFDIDMTSDIEDINWVLENVYVNLFAILTNNFSRFGHNLFIQVGKDGSFGPYIFIDNDRSKWKYHLYEKGKLPENPADHPLATFCKFPRQLVRRFLLLSTLEEQNLSLGRLVFLAISNYQDVPSNPIFTLEEAQYLDSSAKYIVDIINICLDEYPEEEVLFDEVGQKEYDFFEKVIDAFNAQ